eukprot:CAMPEP_0185260584 /NCGR_PEP_ID=MMETSP1359-20130426/9167_1 /TAXON_ID=552665 /ORGANISM="Bigelowiella longifila, Strain CCMP242" /LENGTH=199 /DNA_ID=CAMNT_0027846919 /DNA_START=32 /DNA_END=631 /DNA_ORIENTATION=+
MVEYFVEALDSVILVMPWSQGRMHRDRDQVLILVKSIQDATDKVLTQIPDVTRVAVLGGIEEKHEPSWRKEQDWKQLYQDVMDASPTRWRCNSCTFSNRLSLPWNPSQRCEMCGDSMSWRVKRQIADSVVMISRLHRRRDEEEEKIAKEGRMAKAQAKEWLKRLSEKKPETDKETGEENRKYNACAERLLAGLLAKDNS